MTLDVNDLLIETRLFEHYGIISGLPFHLYVIRLV